MNTFTTSLLRALPRKPTLRVPSTGPLTFTRAESNTRRHTKRLRLPPHPSMIISPTPTQTHIIHNPPSASPSVYSTPNLFLPKEDPRREHFLAINGSKVKTKLPPPVSKPYVKKYHLTEAEFEEIRLLRNKNPDLWTRRKLAEKFNTSSLFIGMVCEATEERKAEMQGRLATLKERWGKRRTAARLERVKRRSGWGGADGF